MFKNVKAFMAGMAIAFKWYEKIIKECKWYIILFVLDMIFMPLKFIIATVMSLTKIGRRKLAYLAKDVLDEED